MPLALLMRPTVILGLLLTLAVIGNVVLYKLHSHDLQTIGALKAQRADALADAKACSDGVAKLRAATEKRDREVAAILRAAAERAKQADAKVAKTLQERPSNPTDMCASALELDRRKLNERLP